MKDDMMYSAKKTLSRREFLCTTCLVPTGVFLPSLRPLWAAQPATKSAGEFGELNATDPGAIDLYLEHKELLVGGKAGRVIATAPSLGRSFGCRRAKRR